MDGRFSTNALLAFLCCLLILRKADGIKFVLEKEECFSDLVPHEGDVVYVSFVVFKWHYSEYGVDLVIKGPNGLTHNSRYKMSEKFEFRAKGGGHHRFCFTNNSPYPAEIDFDVRVSQVTHFNHHAQDEHFAPLLEQIEKLEDALDRIKFEQHWMLAQTGQQAKLNEGISRRAIVKAILESASLIGCSLLQIFLLRRLFERNPVRV